MLSYLWASLQAGMMSFSVDKKPTPHSRSHPPNLGLSAPRSGVQAWCHHSWDEGKGEPQPNQSSWYPTFLCGRRRWCTTRCLHKRSVCQRCGGGGGWVLVWVCVRGSRLWGSHASRHHLHSISLRRCAKPHWPSPQQNPRTLTWSLRCYVFGPVLSKITPDYTTPELLCILVLNRYVVISLLIWEKGSVSYII